MAASFPATAHDLRAGYFELVEAQPAAYEAVWKVPVQAGKRFHVSPQLPPDCDIRPLTSQFTTTGDVIEAWRVTCEETLSGRAISFPGLETTVADILVRFTPLKGGAQTQRATPDKSQVSFAASGTFLSVFATYTKLGVQHIWEGTDHLLFVLCLVFLISSPRKLVETITSFTLAHSLTLVATTLGWIHLSVAPVEAVIALSIVFLASEVLSRRSGHQRLSERQPWLVAFVFGLLHGFGFASALSGIGLPQDAIPTALLAFNVGVEIGQLTFVGAVLIVLSLVRRVSLYRIVEQISVYCAGIMATVWLIERL